MRWLKRSVWMMVIVVAMKAETLRADPSSAAAGPILLAASGDSRGPILSSPDASKGPVATADAPKEEDLTKRILVAQRTLDAAKSVTPKGSKPPEELSQEVELLQQLRMIQSQQKAATERRTELESTKADLNGKLRAASTSGYAEQTVSAYLLLEQLRDELSAERDRAATTTAEVAAADDALLRAKASRDEKERKRRAAKEALETKPEKTDAAETARLDQAVSLAQLDSQLATELVALREAEATNERLAAENHEAQIQLLTLRIESLAKSATFREQDLQSVLDQIAKREAELQQELETAQADSEYPERRWMLARQELDLATDQKSVLVEEVEAWRMTRAAQRRRVASINEQLQRLTQSRNVWRRRYELASGQATVAQIAVWRKETRQTLDEIIRDVRAQTGRVAELRSDLARHEARLQAAKQTPDAAARWVNEQRTQVAALIEVLGANVVSLEASRRLHEKLLAEIEGNAESASTLAWVGDFSSWLVNIWNHELTSVDDRPITTGKIISGVLLLVIGFFLSRWISRLVGRRVFTRFNLHEGAAAALQTILFYGLLVTFTLFALRLVNVPLTAFTILGGALAVGVGFGSQNIVNNFISGLILLAERPVRVGDVIEVGGLTGAVERIGARSTWMRTGANVEIIVPNSTLLQNNVVNWTLSDDKVRTSIRVGVAYGSPTRDVSRVLKKAAEEHGLILPDPEPIVWFTDFGDNALVFELHFWLQLRSLGERRRIESDLRHMIDQRFRDHAIVMAFPQRDVHLNVAAPLDVRLLPPPSPDHSPGDVSRGELPPNAIAPAA